MSSTQKPNTTGDAGDASKHPAQTSRIAQRRGLTVHTCHATRQRFRIWGVLLGLSQAALDSSRRLHPDTWAVELSLRSNCEMAETFMPCPSQNGLTLRHHTSMET